MKDTKPRDRGYRLYQVERTKKQVRWNFRDVMFDYEHQDDIHSNGCHLMGGLDAWIGRTASHNHSCYMCGNPRYHWGEKIYTRQERLSDISFHEQLQELGIDFGQVKTRFTKYHG